MFKAKERVEDPATLSESKAKIISKELLGWRRNKMKLESIGFYTLSDDRCKNGSHKSPLWRTEILLGDKCNFKCPYCRTANNLYNRQLTKDKLFFILGNLFDIKIKNIRFSGGEPTLYKYLPEAIAFCYWQNIKRIAISTNGSADLDYYKKLIDYGVNDFSISLDACCGSTAKIMSGGIDMFNKIIHNIAELSKLTYVTVGIVFDENNINQIQETIKFTHNLGVSDIRIIPSAQYNKCAIFNNFNFEFIDKYPILKYRINNFKAGNNIRGLSERDNSKCPLVLDDIAIAGNYHYPCIIYLREQGGPIGNLNIIENIRSDRLNWYMKHNCHEDKICRNNCLDVCKEYNNRWKEFNDKIN